MTGTPTAFSFVAWSRIEPSGAADTVAVMLNGTGTTFCSFPEACNWPFSIVSFTSRSGDFFVARPCCSSVVSEAPSIARSAARSRKV